MTVVYIAGPMTGRPNYNFGAFEQAAAELHARGYSVLNPGRRGLRDGWVYADYLRQAITDLLQADGIALLPGWEDSRGARLEEQIAKALDLEVGTVADWLTADLEEERPEPAPSSTCLSCGAHLPGAAAHICGLGLPAPSETPPFLPRPQLINGHAVDYKSHRFCCERCGARSLNLMRFHTAPCRPKPPCPICDSTNCLEADHRFAPRNPQENPTT
jgi:hypothetical protein